MKACLNIHLEEPFRSLWAGRDPFVAVEALQGEVFRELEARRTLRTEVGGQSYFVKIHRGVGWGEIIKNLLCRACRAPCDGCAKAVSRVRPCACRAADLVLVAGHGHVV